ncbi:MAG: 7-carboxy-7-deazaguanine synthase QueE [Aquificota bacterium]|nr:7-carboxy-7-deazaguanine synthase QueE [Aquificota bacterium]
MLRDKVRATNALSVNEIYETIQGEGLLAGTPSLFIRIQGCNLRCPWCDQPEALEFRKGIRVSLEEVLARAKESPFRHAVITGGEPFTELNLGRLVKGLLEAGFSVQIETNGTFWNEDLEEVADRIHITCSPKGVADFFVHPKILKHTKELKFVVDDAFTEEVILKEKFRRHLEEGLVVLQPESNREEMISKALSIQRSLSRKGFTVRVIPQIHKFLGIR